MVPKISDNLNSNSILLLFGLSVDNLWKKMLLIIEKSSLISGNKNSKEMLNSSILVLFSITVL